MSSTIYVKKITITLIVAICFSCKPERVDDPIPFQPFDDIVINLSLPQFAALSTDGGFMYINGGVRGLIIYRNVNTYLAFERNCSFQPNDACATVDAYQLYMQDSCCGSTFNYIGTPTGGMAWRPLQQYYTSLSGTILTITDTIVE